VIFAGNKGFWSDAMGLVGNFGSYFMVVFFVGIFGSGFIVTFFGNSNFSSFELFGGYFNLSLTVMFFVVKFNCSSSMVVVSVCNFYCFSAAFNVDFSSIVLFVITFGFAFSVKFAFVFVTILNFAGTYFKAGLPFSLTIISAYILSTLAI
jgi:hypothetical protein